MKRLKIFSLLFILIFTIQCNDENLVNSGYKGDKELKDDAIVPFLLYQNYPNPFNPSTVITFELSRQMNIKLNVYTEDWVKVATIADGTFDPHTYAVTFEADNIPSGEYYYVLKGGGYTQIRKMKLLK